MKKNNKIHQFNSQKGITAADIIIAMLVIMTTLEVIVMVYVNLVANGKDIDILVNAKYILDCLKVISEEFVVLNFVSNIAPFTITSAAGDEYIYLILPLRSFE